MQVEVNLEKGKLRLEFLERILETSKGDYFLGKKVDEITEIS